MTTSMLRFCAAIASSSSSSSPTSHASLVMLSNSWKVVAFLGLPGVAGGGLLPALIKLDEVVEQLKEQKAEGLKKIDQNDHHLNMKSKITHSTVHFLNK